MLVSVFIPTYNASACIDGTLQSVLGQSYQELEVWVVDDCSTDDTVAKLQQWQKCDARVHLLTKEQNEGFVPYSWNRVAPLMKGDFVFYMSHDDRLGTDCIELLVRAQQQTGVDMVIPDCVFTYDDGRQVSQLSIANCQLSIISSRQAFARMLNYDIPGFALWRTSLIRPENYQLSIINSQLAVMPTDAWNGDEGMQRIWALNSRHGVALCPEAKFFYHITEASITKGLKPYHITGLRTQHRLFVAALKAGIWLQYPRAFVRFAWQYLKSYLYLKRNLSA